MMSEGAAKNSIDADKQPPSLETLYQEILQLSQADSLSLPDVIKKTNEFLRHDGNSSSADTESFKEHYKIVSIIHALANWSALCEQATQQFQDSVKEDTANKPNYTNALKKLEMLKNARQYINGNITIEGEATSVTASAHEACNTVELLNALETLLATQAEVDATIEEMNMTKKGGYVQVDSLTTLYNSIIELMKASGGLTENEKTIQQKIDLFLQIFGKETTSVERRGEFSKENSAINLINFYAKWLSYLDIIASNFSKIQRQSISHATSVQSGPEEPLAKAASDALTDLRVIAKQVAEYGNPIVPDDASNLIADLKRQCSNESLVTAQEQYEALFKTFYKANCKAKKTTQGIFLEYALILFNRAAYEKFPTQDSEAKKACVVLKQADALKDGDISGFNDWMERREQLMTIAHDLSKKKPVNRSSAESIYAGIAGRNTSYEYQLNGRDDCFDFAKYIEPDQRLWIEIEKWFAINASYDFSNDSFKLDSANISQAGKKAALVEIIGYITLQAPQAPSPSPRTFVGSGTKLFSKTKEQVIYEDWQAVSAPLLTKLNAISKNAANDYNFFENAINELATNIQLSLSDTYVPLINPRGTMPGKKNMAEILRYMMIEKCQTLTEKNFPTQAYLETDGFYLLRISRVLRQFAGNIYGYGRCHSVSSTQSESVKPPIF